MLSATPKKRKQSEWGGRRNLNNFSSLQPPQFPTKRLICFKFRFHQNEQEAIKVPKKVEVLAFISGVKKLKSSVFFTLEISYCRRFSGEHMALSARECNPVFRHASRSSTIFEENSLRSTCGFAFITGVRTRLGLGSWVFYNFAFLVTGGSALAATNAS